MRKAHRLQNPEISDEVLALLSINSAYVLCRRDQPMRVAGATLRARGNDPTPNTQPLLFVVPELRALPGYKARTDDLFGLGQFCSGLRNRFRRRGFQNSKTYTNPEIALSEMGGA